MHFAKLPVFRGVVKSFSESGGEHVCLGEQHSEALGRRVFTYFSGCWVPEIFDTKKYQNKRNEQDAEEHSADLVSGAGLLSRLGCFCLINDKRAIASGPLTIQGGTSTRAYQTSITLTSCTVAKQATNLRPESGSPPGSPEPSLPWSPPCARTRARSEVEFQEALGCTCGGEGWVTAAPVTAAASFSPPQPAGPRVLPQSSPFARRERFPRFWRRARTKLYRAFSVGHVQGPLFLAQALLLPSASDGWRCPGCAPGTWALLLSGGPLARADACGGGGGFRSGDSPGAAHGCAYARAFGRTRARSHGHGCARAYVRARLGARGGVHAHTRGCARTRTCAHAHCQPSAMRWEARDLPVEGSGILLPLCAKPCPKVGLARNFLTNSFFCYIQKFPFVEIIPFFFFFFFHGNEPILRKAFRNPA